MALVLAILALFLTGCVLFTNVEMLIDEKNDSCEIGLKGVEHPNEMRGCLRWQGEKCYVEVGECRDLQ